jgi:transposase-like protein
MNENPNGRVEMDSLVTDYNFINSVGINEIILEYNNYKKKQEKIIENLKMVTRDLSLNKCKYFDKYLLDNKCSTKQKYTCELCNSYFSNTKKGMAAHKKGCKKKQVNIIAI